MKPFAFLIPALALASCATVRESYGPDGRKAYMINCTALTLNWGHCQKAAGEKCGAAGYDIVYQTQEDAFSMAANANRYQGSMYAGTSSARSMMVSCRE